MTASLDRRQLTTTDAMAAEALEKMIIAILVTDGSTRWNSCGRARLDVAGAIIAFVVEGH